MCLHCQVFPWFLTFPAFAAQNVVILTKIHRNDWDLLMRSWIFMGNFDQIYSHRGRKHFAKKLSKVVQYDGKLLKLLMIN